MSFEIIIFIMSIFLLLGVICICYLLLKQKEMFAKVSILSEKLSVFQQIDIENQNENKTSLQNILTKMHIIDKTGEQFSKLESGVSDLVGILANKQSRGYWGEQQLQVILQDILPSSLYKLQYTLVTGVKPDCVLCFSERDLLAIDAKFPLEDFKKIVEERKREESLDSRLFSKFATQLKKHVDACASKYIIANVTMPWTVLFLPSEVIFHQILEHMPEVLAYARQREVIIVSPTTLPVVLFSVKHMEQQDNIQANVELIKKTFLAIQENTQRFVQRYEKTSLALKKVNDHFQDLEIAFLKIVKHTKVLEKM